MTHEKDTTPREDHRPIAKAHWTIYLPSLVVALLWAGFYLRARFGVPPMPAIATLCLIVEAAAVPVLLVLAWGRARNLLVMLSSGDLLTCAGFPLKTERRIALSEISHMAVRRGPVQRIFGGAALVVTLASGGRHVVNDLDQADAIVAAFNQAR